MRTAAGVGLLAACLCLTGCSLSGKKPAAAPPPGDRAAVPDWPPRPAGSQAPAPATPASGTRGELDGVLAGQVRDRFDRRLPNVSIDVVDLQAGRQAAPIRMTSDGEGYFWIPGLQAGRHYQLIARVKEGDRMLSGVSVVTPPNPRMVIFISDDFNSPTTPAPLGPPELPGRPDSPRPKAVLDPPANLPSGDTGGSWGTTPPRPGDTRTGPENRTSVPQPSPAVAPDRIANEQKEGFTRIYPPPSIGVNVPGPGETQNRVLPAPPPWKPKESKPPSPDPLRGDRSSQLPGPESAAPSCVLNGLQLTNFALPDVNYYGDNGKIWEYRKDHAARLTLLDFWHTECPPCQMAVPYLVKLQDYYDRNYPKTLQVVGIAYESGTPQEQADKVRRFRGRYSIKYPTLLGDRVRCPVFEQFGVEAYPTFVLLDENGKIVWRRQGFDSAVLAEMDAAVRKQLGR